jgi:hypothetical protein
MKTGQDPVDKVDVFLLPKGIYTIRTRKGFARFVKE